ncbi:MAG TPA: pitrilysin family protein [Tepidisphaeraceae bacterium]|nr:pitrilysin family protein [Tepidisphaeraceae bacterium]
MYSIRKKIGQISVLMLFLVVSATWGASLQLEPIQYEKETLANGLRVIYAPMHQAPVVHVRVLYHVGSRDENPQRQGFAHMFEHMMFRGSAHVPPEQHMKLIDGVGGDSNAFTSFDQTTYVNTIPSNAVQMALYLEADRMASFKVNDNIFQTERKVVAEEWRMRTANPPLGTLEQDFFRTAYNAHSYRWTPIGDMDQLRQASSDELQHFFNTYYVPNNACLIVAGDIDVARTKQWVARYFGWIPKGGDVPRKMPAEPVQNQARELVVYKPNVPLTNVYMGFKTTDYKSDDHFALGLLGDILSSGRTGKLDRQFVNGANPVCLSVGAGDWQLEDQSLFVIEAVVQQGQNPDKVRKDVLAAVYEVAEKGVTTEELEKVRTQQRQALVRGRQTCTQIATALGDEEVFGGNAERANQMLAKIDAVTLADIQAVAKKYLRPDGVTVVEYRPDPTGINARKAATMQAAASKADQLKDAPVVASSEPIQPRVSQFPAGYPTEPPIDGGVVQAHFNKGTETTVAGMKIITLTDHRLPLVNISLIMPGGSDSESSDKIAIGGFTSQMLRRGTAGVPFLDFSADLESKGISIDAADAQDTTRLNISCTTDELDYAIEKANKVLASPDFPKEEFDKLQKQHIGGLMQSLSDPSTVAQRELVSTLYEGSTLGRVTTKKTLESLTLDDVKNWYQKFYQLDGAWIIVAGDVTEQKAAQLAEKLVAGISRRSAPPPADYSTKPPSDKRRIILVDNPEGKQATIRAAIRAYDIHTDEKYAGMLAGNILSSGIEGRLNKYVRAEKGLTYGAYAYFRPNRHAGEFNGSLATNPDTTADAVVAVNKVLDDMKAADVTNVELSEAKTRTIGSLVMEMQTVAQQAGRRLDQVLNGYPIDYWDTLPQHLADVKPEQIRAVMNKYVNEDRMIYVIVAPGVVKQQLEKLGDVEVRPMPLNREISSSHVDEGGG